MLRTKELHHDDSGEADAGAGSVKEETQQSFHVHRGELPARASEADAPSSCVVGIDLGTTNSAIAIPRTRAMRFDSSEARARREGVDIIVDKYDRKSRTTPSVVGFVDPSASSSEYIGEGARYSTQTGGDVLVGQLARNNASRIHPSNTFHSVKRLIGRTAEEVKMKNIRREEGSGSSAERRFEEEMLRVKFDVSYDVSSSHIVKGCDRMRVLASGVEHVVSVAANEEDDDDILLLCPALNGDTLNAASSTDVLNGQKNVRGILRPEEVSAFVVRKLIDDARHDLESSSLADKGRGTSKKSQYSRERNEVVDSISKAVITVPAYFNDKQMRATQAAGKLAGLETVRTIREPMAAALSYGLDKEDDQRVMVFDLGGGTFDVSVLEIGGGSIEVKATGGDAFLGGDDFDERICRWMGREYCRDNGMRSDEWMSFPREQRSRLMAAAEKAKQFLTTETEMAMIMRGLDGDKSRNRETELRLSRAKFERLCEDLLVRCRDPIEQACAQSGVDLESMRSSYQQLRNKKGKKLRDRDVREWRKLQPISEVILVGGATRMPAIHRFVKNLTGIQPRWTVNPDEVVAEGAAIQAGIYQGEINNMYVMDTWQASLMRAIALREVQKQKRQQSEK